MKAATMIFVCVGLVLFSCSRKSNDLGESPPSWGPGISFVLEQPNEATVGDEFDVEIMAIVDSNSNFRACQYSDSNSVNGLDTTTLHQLRVYWTQYLFTGPIHHIDDPPESGFVPVSGLREDTFYVNQGDTVKLRCRLRAVHAGQGYLYAKAHFTDDAFLCPLLIIGGQENPSPKHIWLSGKTTAISQ